jgi:glycolate oxidase FAD binding subunit
VSGSHGTLAGIADVTFKLVPIPQTSATLVAWYAEAAALARDVAILDATQIESAAFDVRMQDGDMPFQLKVRIATSPAACDAQIAAARRLIAGQTTVLTDIAEQASWASQMDPMGHGDATLRLSWLPSRLPEVLATLEALQRSGIRLLFAGRVVGAGALRLSGDVQALATAVERLRASADAAHVVILRGSRELKERVDVWGPELSSDRVARAVKQALDPAGILNAGRGPI